MSEEETDGSSRVQDARILAMRDAGVSWKEIAAAFDLSRQQARHGYQRALRMRRRAERREGH